MATTFEFGHFQAESGGDSDWRKSLFKSAKVNRNNEVLRRRREELQAFAKQNKDLVTLRGVSLEALNDFWKKIRGNQRYQNRELLILKKQVEQVPVGSTVQKEQECREEDEILLRCYHAETGSYITVDERYVEPKDRRLWTVSDIISYGIMQDTTMTKKPFVERLEEDSRGTPFTGSYVIYSQDCLFEDLLIALRAHVSEGAEGAPGDNAFFWLEMFCTTMPMVKDQLASGDKEKIVETINCFNLIGELFDERLIHFSSWHRPNVLDCLYGVYKVFQVFRSDNSFEIVVKPGEAKNFVQVYDSDEPGIFKVIEEMDPTGVQKGLLEEGFADILIDQLTTDLEYGFTTVRDAFAGKFRRFFVKEVEDHVKTFVEAVDPVKREQFAIFLYKAGNFLRKHNEFEVAKTYFNKAKANYEELQRYNEDLDKRRRDPEDITVQELIAIDRVNGGASKVYMYQAMIALAEGDLEKCKSLLNSSEDEAKKIQTQKHAFFADISEVRSEMQYKLHNLKGSIEELTAVSLILKEERHKYSRQKYARMELQLALRYKEKKEYKKASQCLATAEAATKKEFGSENLEFANVLVAKGNLALKQKDDLKAIDNLLKAEDIILRNVGRINETLGKVRSNLALCHVRRGGNENLELALEWYAKAAETFEKAMGKYSLSLGRILSTAGLVLRQLSREDAAEEMLIRALACLTAQKQDVENTKSLDNATREEKERIALLANTYSNIGQTQEFHQRIMDASKSYLIAYNLTKQLYGEHSSKTVQRKERWEKADEEARVRRLRLSKEVEDLF